MNFKGIELNERVTKYHFVSNGKKLSFLDWINKMKASDEVILSFNQVLKDSPFDAYFWEVMPVNQSDLNKDFEFVLVKSSSLESISANDSAFKKYFNEKESVVNFPNLRGDAELVVPTVASNKTEYAHIAKFVRTATALHVAEFWRKVVETYESKICNDPKWLSTSGLGVYWLHVRIDSVPKYYQHKEYKG